MRASVLVLLTACAASARPPAESNLGGVAAAPVWTDTDDDGVDDARDRCGDGAEDFDAFEDDDGCPDPDNDGDGVLDAADLCAYTRGLAEGCPTACAHVIRTMGDCILQPDVRYDEHGVPDARRLDEIVALLHANRSISGLEVIGVQAAFVVAPLRERLPGVVIVEDTRDVLLGRTVYVRITDQRFHDGRFRSLECTAFGAIYHPKRADDCTQ